MRSFFRALTFALQDIGRNLGLSLMTIFVLILTLLSVNTFLIIRVITDEATRSIKDQIDVSIYFTPEADQGAVDELQQFIVSFPEVTQSTFLTREQSLEAFKAQHADNPDILKSLDELGENPLGATLIIKTKEPSDYQKIFGAIDIPEYASVIESKTFTDTENAITKIDTITQHIEQFSLVLIIIFAVITFLIIFNTIRVAIYTQRAEISIKKLVGATNWLIQGPYVFMCFIFSAVSVVTTGIIVYFVVEMLDPYMGLVFGQNNVLTNQLNSNIVELFAIQMAAVFVLTLISAMMAMRRHLRV